MFHPLANACAPRGGYRLVVEVAATIPQRKKRIDLSWPATIDFLDTFHPAMLVSKLRGIYDD